jgi:LPXTG-motif cell wall-anchored protein
MKRELLEWLDAQRSHVAEQVRAMPAEARRRSYVPSGWTPRGVTSEDGLVSGNQTDTTVTAPVTVSGNQVVVAGEDNTHTGDTTTGTSNGTSNGSGEVAGVSGIVSGGVGMPAAGVSGVSGVRETAALPQTGATGAAGALLMGGLLLTTSGIGVLLLRRNRGDALA